MTRSLPARCLRCNNWVRALLLSGVLVIVLACFACRSAPPPGNDDQDPRDITIALDRTDYAIGDLAKITITNNTEELVFFALVCDGFLEGRERDEWQTIFERDCSNVRVAPTRLEGGKSTTAEFEIQVTERETLPRFYAFRIRVRFQFVDGGYHLGYSSWFSVNGS